MTVDPIDIHKYLDYRQFLHDWFWLAKSGNSKVSFRYMAKHLGLSAPNHFHLVISDRRHVSPQVLEKIGRFLKLGPRERQYLRLIFKLSRSKNEEERLEIQAKVVQLQQLYIQDQGHDASAHSKNLNIVGHTLAWYIKMAAVKLQGLSRENLLSKVQKSLCFKSSLQDTQSAIDLLVQTDQLKFECDKEGEKACERAHFDESEINTKWNFDSDQIKAHHRANLSLALESIPWPIDRRTLTSVSIAVDEALYEEMITDMRTLCQSILEKSKQRITSSTDAKKVVTLQLSLFPFFEFE